MIDFSKENIFLPALKIVKGNLSFFIGFILCVSLIHIAPELILRKYNIDLSKNENLSILIQILLFLIQLGVGYLMVKIPLLAIDNIEINKENIFSSVKTLFNYTIGTAIYGIGIILLLVLMGRLGQFGVIILIPLVFIVLKFQFVNYILIDKKTDVIAAFKISHEITKDHMVALFQFVMTLFFLNLLGAFAFFIGLLVTLPISIVSISLVYRELISKLSFENEG